MLNLHYQTVSSVPVEVEGVVPNAVRELSLAEIERFEIFHGNVKVPLAEFFRVSGDPSDERIEWQGDLSGVHWIGAHMTAGTIRVAGHAGRHLGSEMRAGEIDVEGNAGDWAGGELHGGTIRIRGRAGHLAGAAYRGSARGMTGGTLLIHGDAGNEIGHSMRRGLVAVGGNVGDLAGFNMLAGTILIGGESGIRHGAGMRRGTICFLETPPRLLPSFRRACRCRPGFLEVLFRQLQLQGFPLPEQAASSDYELYHGDMIEGGRGEILLRAA